jgi:integrase
MAKTQKQKTTEPIADGIFRYLITNAHVKAGNFRVTWLNQYKKQKEKGFPADTPIDYLKSFRAHQEKIAADAAAVHAFKTHSSGSFTRDIVTFLKTRKRLPCYKSDKSHLRPWARKFGRLSRHSITREMVLSALASWDFSPRELRHRINILRQVFYFKDGDLATTPCDRISSRKHSFLKVKKTRPKLVADNVIDVVAGNLLQAELNGRLRDGKTRARFLVLATCAKRPCQVMRADPKDVNLTTRIWDVTPAKNSTGGELYLNDDMLNAWKLFIAADAWGDYDGVSFSKTIRRNGWPGGRGGVRPYNMRHGTLQTMRNRDVDLGDVQQAAGHESPETTARFYTYGELERSKKAGAKIDGRFSSDVFAPRTPQKYDDTNDNQ